MYPSMVHQNQGSDQYPESQSSETERQFNPRQQTGYHPALIVNSVIFFAWFQHLQKAKQLEAELKLGSKPSTPAGLKRFGTPTKNMPNKLQKVCDWRSKKSSSVIRKNVERC